MDVIGWLLTVLGAVAIHLVGSEIYAHAPFIARHLIAYAAAKLPAPVRARYKEEWLAHLDECKGGISKLLHGLGCLTCVYKIHNLNTVKFKFVITIQFRIGHRITISLPLRTSVRVDRATTSFITAVLGKAISMIDSTGLNGDVLKDFADRLAKKQANVGLPPDRRAVERFIGAGDRYSWLKRLGCVMGDRQITLQD